MIKKILEGWLIIFKLLVSVIKRYFRRLCQLLKLIGLCKPQGPSHSDECCVRPPSDIRARPDPYIYSQYWLELRNIAYTWDNPDFTIVDPADPNTAVDSHALQPKTNYLVRAAIHNNSIMPAFGTSVQFRVLKFGAGTPVLQDLDTVTIDVPPAGVAIAEVNWLTPETAGHNCLQAIISHPDDANPLNNVGQNNTDVAMPASPTRKLSFHVGNQGGQTKDLRLVMNSYRLPDKPLQPRDSEDRRSLNYLRRLQAANDFRRFPALASLRARLSRDTVKLEPGEEIEVSLEMNPPAKGTGRQNVNVNVFDGTDLVGGITAYVDEEE